MEDENVIVNSDINENNMNLMNTQERLGNFKVSDSGDNLGQIRVCENKNEAKVINNTDKETKTTDLSYNPEEITTTEQNIIVENSPYLLSNTTKANRVTQQSNTVENPTQSDNEDVLKSSQDILSYDTEENSASQQKAIVENTSKSDHEENVHRNARTKKKKRATIVDSDSEESDTPIDTEKNNISQQKVIVENTTESDNEENVHTIARAKKKKRAIIADSDSEDDIDIPIDTEKNCTSLQKVIVENTTESDNEENVHRNARTKKKKRATIVDSDSEDDIDIPIDTEKNCTSLQKVIVENTAESDNEENVHRNARVKKKKRATIADGDSEEDDILSTTLIEENSLDLPEENIIIEKKKHKRFTMDDSDYDIENEVITPHNKSFVEEMKCNTTDVIPGDNLEKKKSRRSSLYDSESSEEDNNLNEYEDHTEDNECIEPVAYKKKSKKKNEEDAPKKMSNKEAADLRKEIKSESQRMLRETNISLPYHKPKSHTLKEFLARRPKLASAVPLKVNTPPSIAIKMSTEQLKVITINLKEREKEVKKFYESEEEAVDEEDEDYVPPGKEKNKEITQLKENNNLETNQSLEPSVCGSNKINIIDIQIIPAQKDVPKEKPSVNVNCINISKDTFNIDNDTEQLAMSMEQNTQCDTENSQSYDHSDYTAIVEENIPICTTEENILHTESSKELAMSVELKQNIQCDAVDSESYENDDDTGPIENKIPSCTIEENILHIKSSKDTNETFVEAIVSEPIQNLEQDVFMEEYQFSLDDVEENSEKQILDEDVTEKQRSKFEFTNLEREIENFGTNNTVIPKKSKLELIRERLANFKPRLSGGPDEVIDLENKVVRPNEVTKLVERFLLHTTKKQVHKNKVKLSIISVESGEIHKETVAMKVDEEEDVSMIEEKPGAKLQKLRDELQAQMAQKRAEFWQKKTTGNPDDEKSKDEGGEKEDYEVGDDILDDEDEEVEMTESSEEEDEAEIEDKELGDKPTKPKSEFLDEEAEESDIEDDEAIEADDEDDENAENADCELSEDENTKEVCSVKEEPEVEPVKKPLRRILQAFADDSDDDEQDCDSQIAAVDESVREKGLDVDGSSQYDDFIPPAQLQSSGTTPLTQFTQSRSEFEFLTPISYMTGLQNLNSSLKCTKMSPLSSTMAPSPLKDANWQDDLQKRLFTDSEITDSQLEAINPSPIKFTQTQEVKEVDTLNEEELGNICSGSFPKTQENNEVDSLNEEELGNICSGKFSLTTSSKSENQTPHPDSQIVVAGEGFPSSQDLLDICSGKFTGFTNLIEPEKPKTEPRNKVDVYTFNAKSEIKSLDEDQDLIISQLINEEEMEMFKRKFDSPLLSNTQKRIVEEFEEAVASSGVIESDEEEDTLEIKKRKNQKRLMFSDESSADEEEKEEPIDLHDVDDDEEEELDTDIPADNIGYDSEENEIELMKETGNEAEGVGGRPKASEFFENEAELSESEWGSADEDEKDLDTMEFEQGDAENFDEKKMKSDLERIHMRRLLDDDTREVKMLQELLLEDGELHGIGRERQFRWRNIDSMQDGEEERKEEDEVYLDEEESEEQWRKRRHKREMFLLEKQKKSQEIEDDDLLKESQLLKIGHKVIQRSQSNSQNGTPAEKDRAPSPVIKHFNIMNNKRGSFLSRGDQMLQRLAEYNKVSAVVVGAAKNSRNFLFQSVSMEETTIVEKNNKRGSFLSRGDQMLQRLAEYNKVSAVVVGAAKNSRNFLFQSVSMEETTIVEKNKKRKAADGTPNAIKKLRLSSNLSPAAKKKDPKSKAKLFGNW